MDQTQKTRRHHFVPKCYLEQFIIDDSLYVLDVRKVKKGYREMPKKMQPGGICYLEDYYTIEEEYIDDTFKLGNVEDELFIESTVLKSFEDRYNDLCKKITDDGQLSFEESTVFSDFIIQLKIRNPFYFENTVKKNARSWLETSSTKPYEESLQSDFPFPNIPLELRKMFIDYMVAQSKNDTHYDRKLHLSGLIRRFTDSFYDKEVFYKPIISSQWSLFIAPKEGPYFITSDNPGFSTSLIDDKIYNTKFNESFCFHLPLSPRFCLLISDFGKDDCYSAGSSKTIYPLAVDGNMVIKMNDKAIQQINKLLIASDDWYLTQIGNLNKPMS